MDESCRQLPVSLDFLIHDIFRNDLILTISILGVGGGDSGPLIHF